MDLFVRRWYSNHLRAMSEPALSCGSGGNQDVYRFTWLRTFHHPIAVRVTHSDGGTVLEAVELGGAGGYEPGKVIRQIRKPLSPREWEALADRIEKAEFWQQPSHDAAGDSGRDGAQWIVEGRHAHTYHVVDRWSPSEGAYRALGLRFIELSGFHPDSIY